MSNLFRVLEQQEAAKMKLRTLVFVALVVVVSAKLSEDDNDDSLECDSCSVKKFSLMELLDKDSSSKKSLMKLIALMKVVGVIGMPALKMLVEAKMKRLQNKHGEAGYDQLEYVPGYDSLGNVVYWAQKKEGSPFPSMLKSKWQL